MSLEIKLGGNEMRFWDKKKKEDENVSDGPKDPSRRLFMKSAGRTGIAAAGAYVGISLGLDALGKSDANAKINKVPGAIETDSDEKVVLAWWDMINDRYFEHPYNCNNIEMAKRILRLSDGPTYAGVVSDESMKTSHAYYMTVAKLHELSEKPLKKHLREECDNLGLELFARAYIDTIQLPGKPPEYNRAKKQAAHGLFVNTSIGIGELGDAQRKANEFVNADIINKEIMLRTEFAKFEKTKANTKNTDINSMEYKLKSAYYNLGIYILADYGNGNQRNGNQREALQLKNNSNNTYQNLFKQFDFDTANGKLL